VASAAASPVRERRAVDAPASDGSASEPRPVASLTPHLLARKGGARPAMRPQYAPLDPAEPTGPSAAESPAPALEDLGWNDMGDAIAHDLPRASCVVDFPRSVASRPSAAAATAAWARRPRGAALADGGKAAFTLRLDAERHLKLRLACSLDACSAQALVTDALDRLLAEMPELEAMSDAASRHRRPASRRQS
jgi:hypothetical protein